MPLADFDTPADWARDLDTRWPERIEMRTLILQTLRRRASGRILELGFGDAGLLTQLTRTLPAAQFVAIDSNDLLLESGRQRLPDDVVLLRRDLRERWSATVGGPFDVVYSLQTFHDLGGRDALQDVYAQAASLLSPGGLLLNADFVVPMAHDDPASPRRFPIDEHLRLLADCGLQDARALGASGKLACIAADAR